MGVVSIGLAYSLNIGDGVTKAVLIALADSACDTCGLAWPGMACLERKTEFGATAIRKALSELSAQGIVHARAYVKGGRGRSTEYILLSRFRELSTAPCVKCQANMAKPPRGGGYDKGGTHKPIATRGVTEESGAKPIAGTEINPSRGGDHPSVESIHQENRKETSAAPQRVISEPNPTIPPDAPLWLRSLADKHRAKIGDESP